MSCIYASANVIFCKVAAFDDNIWYIMFVYGAPRVAVWSTISSLLIPLSKVLIIGDFNQVELHSDKIGGSSFVRGWEDFLDLRLSMQLLEVPFSGPQCTWTNNHNDSSLILERLDRAYMLS